MVFVSFVYIFTQEANQILSKKTLDKSLFSVDSVIFDCGMFITFTVYGDRIC